MRPQVVSRTGVGVTPWIPVDFRAQNFQIGLAAVVTGTVTYTVEHTSDPIMDPTNTAPITAFPNSGMTALTVNANGNYAFPIQAVRINVTAGTGTVTLTIVHSSGQG